MNVREREQGFARTIETVFESKKEISTYSERFTLCAVLFRADRRTNTFYERYCG